MNKAIRFNAGLMTTKALLIVLLACWGGGTALAQANQVDLNALTAETQKMHPDADRMTLVWWVPGEFWEATLAQDPTTTKAQAAQFMEILSPYTLVVVVDGKVGPLGGVTYKTEETIRETIRLVDGQGTAYRPLGKEKIGADTRNLLAVMKPILSNMMGQMGENMNFILFPAKSKTGLKIVEAGKEGSFTVKLGESDFVWRLPLGALLPAKICPVDGERLNGAWKFCPWHGDRLVTKPAK
jgi:hypothetical protein